MDVMPANRAKADFAELVKRVAEGKERIALTRNGETLAVVVPVEDAEALEAMEDDRDRHDAEAALAEFEASGKPSISWDEVKRKAGI